MLACGAYLAYFIFQTSFVIGGTRYFALFDDAMISMQYARNFAEGNGLVYSVGAERVEGFSNPAVGRLYGVDPPFWLAFQSG